MVPACLFNVMSQFMLRHVPTTAQFPELSRIWTALKIHNTSPHGRRLKTGHVFVQARKVKPTDLNVSPNRSLDKPYHHRQVRHNPCASRARWKYVATDTFCKTVRKFSQTRMTFSGSRQKLSGKGAPTENTTNPCTNPSPCRAEWHKCAR